MNGFIEWRCSMGVLLLFCWGIVRLTVASSENSDSSSSPLPPTTQNNSTLQQSNETAHGNKRFGEHFLVECGERRTNWSDWCRWHDFSFTVFRGDPKAVPPPSSSLLGASCDFQLYSEYSPAYLMAFPPSDAKDDVEKIQKVLDRHDALEFFFNSLNDSSEQKPEYPYGKEGAEYFQKLLQVWTNIGKDESAEQSKLWRGRLLSEKVCYSSKGDEMFECNQKTGKCDCLVSGNLKALKMKRSHRMSLRKNIHGFSTHLRLDKNSYYCHSEDCGKCLVDSRTSCGYFGFCSDTLVSKRQPWPFTHLNGTCKDSILKKNSRPKGQKELNISDLLSTAMSLNPSPQNAMIIYAISKICVNCL